jgi:hypothetical protein
MNIYKQRYFEQKQNARRRNIPFELSFYEWYKIWMDSGKWDQRGKGAGKYVMSRNNDIGPYAVGNVYINLCEDNAQQTNKGVTFDVVHKQNIAKALRGKMKTLQHNVNNSLGQLNRPKHNCPKCDKLISGLGNLKQHLTGVHKETI